MGRNAVCVNGLIIDVYNSHFEDKNVKLAIFLVLCGAYKVEEAVDLHVDNYMVEMLFVSVD